jgi:hypothetical protein
MGIAQKKNIPLTDKGFIPAWLAAGPFELPLVGFGVPADSNMIGEKTIEPYPGKEEKDALVKEGTTKWIALSPGNNGFVNFNTSLRWTYPHEKSPDKIWYALTGYAAAYIESLEEQQVTLAYGSNSFGKILLNGIEVFSLQNARNAVPDENKIPVTLKKGKNLLLVKVGNSHANHQLSFFDPVRWEWGFYLRLLDNNGSPVQNVNVILPEAGDKPEIDIISTFFFKKSGSGLTQRFDIVINSPETELQKGDVTVKINGKDYKKAIDSIPFGYSRHELYVPELSKDVKASVSLLLHNKTIKKDITLYVQPHYELYMMMLSHMDIGYTHPQSVVKEMQANTLDDVINLCEKDPNFKWTIETLWQLEQFEQTRTPERYQKLAALIKEGRVAVSPLYSNPYTGWVGEEEMIRGLAPAKKYKDEFGIKYYGAIYNDVPGQAWIVPQVLKNAGVEFVAEGLNELFNDYSFQRSLPKVFIWEGGDSSRVVAYLNAAYNEGKHYGLEKRGNFAVQQRMWEKLNKLKSDGYNYDMVLLNSTYGDNNTIPFDEYYSMLDWNKEYEYPKFISSHISEFAEKFIKKYKNTLPVIRGDWTSSWDINYQGEPDNMRKQRWVQHNLLSAEKILTINSMYNPGILPMHKHVNDAYRSILNFSGHGSGIEYGYASPAENFITLDFRDKYVHDAFMDTEELLMRGMWRTGKPEETFEGEGILVYNSLSWERSVPVEVQFVEQAAQQYEVIDIETKETIPSFRDGYKLFFVAKDLPSLGYKKYRLNPVPKVPGLKETDLKVSAGTVENKYYKIEFNSATGRIEKVTDKKTGKQINDTKSQFGFAIPVIERFQLKESYKDMELPAGTIEIKDESPVRITVNVKREGSLFENTAITLWTGLDKADIDYTINLNALKATDHVEDYGIAFPFDIDNQQELIEIAGGYLNPEKDKLPGSGKDSYTIRRGAALFNDNQSISWSSADARVMKLKGEGNNKTIISNLVNNFPAGWNRNESNDKVITFRYSFTNQQGGFNPAYTSRFGWDFNTPALVRRSWYRSEPPVMSYMNISNENIGLITLMPGESADNFILRLINFNNSSNEEAVISSELFNGVTASYCNYLNEEIKPLAADTNTIKVKLKPNEIATIKVKKPGNQVMNQGR